MKGRRSRIAPDERRCVAVCATYSDQRRGYQAFGDRCRKAATQWVDSLRLCTGHARIARNEETGYGRRLTVRDKQDIYRVFRAFRQELGLLPDEPYRPRRWERELAGVLSYTEVAALSGISLPVICHYAKYGTERSARHGRATQNPRV